MRAGRYYHYLINANHNLCNVTPERHKMHGAAWANIAIGTHKQYTSHKSGINSVSHESSIVRQYIDAYQSHSTPLASSPGSLGGGEPGDETKHPPSSSTTL